MGGRAGGGASGGMGSGSRGGMSGRARELANKYLGGVSDPKLKKELADGMAAFEKEFGIPVFGNGAGRGGLTVSVQDLGETTAASVNGMGHLVVNSRFTTGQLPMSHAKHSMIHELTHGLDKTNAFNLTNGEWSSKGGGKFVVKKENKGFDRKLTAAYKQFKKNYGSTQTKQIGSYALKSKHEFFAEAVASHMTGTKNNYTTFAYNLAKSMSGK